MNGILLLSSFVLLRCLLICVKSLNLRFLLFLLFACLGLRSLNILLGVFVRILVMSFLVLKIPFNLIYYLLCHNLILHILRLRKCLSLKVFMILLMA
nr:MAG TPA: hypothetical protein [Crassvirales sp.]